jgi:hypothetical protein
MNCSRSRHAPGIVAASVAQQIPLERSHGGTATLEADTDPRSTGLPVNWNFVAPGILLFSRIRHSVFVRTRLSGQWGRTKIAVSVLNLAVCLRFTDPFCGRLCGECPARIPSFHWPNRRRESDSRRCLRFGTLCGLAQGGRCWRLPPPPHFRSIRNS